LALPPGTSYSIFLFFQSAVDKNSNVGVQHAAHTCTQYICAYNIHNDEHVVQRKSGNRRAIRAKYIRYDGKKKKNYLDRRRKTEIVFISWMCTRNRVFNLYVVVYARTVVKRKKD
jgi:hypothetical protein